MKLEFHQLNRRYDHLRVRNPEVQQRLLASLAASGQQTPIVVVAILDKPNRYQVFSSNWQYFETLANLAPASAAN